MRSVYPARRIPLYYEAKLLFVLWLWYPSSKGALSLYTHTLQPLLSAHEATIDRTLAETRELLFDSFSANFSKCIPPFLHSCTCFQIAALRQVHPKISMTAWPSIPAMLQLHEVQGSR